MEKRRGYKRGYRIQMVGPAAKALVVGQPTVGNSARQYGTVRVNSTRQVSAVTAFNKIRIYKGDEKYTALYI